MGTNPRDIPLLFADGIANFAHSAEIARFYLYRFDPGAEGVTDRADATVTGVSQIVMPFGAALDAAAFLLNAIDNLSAKDAAVAEKWKKAKANASAEAVPK
jgi:hypothetical protein